MLEKLYHISPSLYRNKILKIGLIPKSQNKMQSHPERIYCFQSNENIEMYAKILFWFITTIAGIGVTFIVIAVKIFLAATNEKFNILFSKIDDLLDKIDTLVSTDEFKSLENRVRKIERKMYRCPGCNKITDTE